MIIYLIDPERKEIVEVEYFGDYKEMHALLACETFTNPLIWPNHDALFVDDEGLINGNPLGWIQLLDYHQPLRGRGLVMGTDSNGDTVEPGAPIDWYRGRVKFPSEEEVEAAGGVDTTVHFIPL